MLAKLADFGKANGFFTLKPLGQLEKSCCPYAQTEVIDFDEAKAKVAENHNMQQPKSADALKLLPHLNRLDFIELKGFQEFIRRQYQSSDIDGKIQQQIAKFALADKIHDSLLILSLLTKHKDFSCTRADQQQYRSAEKHYLIVVDIDLPHNPMQARAIGLTFLSDTSNVQQKIAQRLQQALTDMPGSSLENLQTPKLFSCKTLDAHYQNPLKQPSQQGI